MVEVADLMENPWFVLILVLDLALIIATVRLVRQSNHLKLRWLWLILAIVWPVLAIIFASQKFQRKWLWLTFSVIAPSISFGAAQTRHLLTTSIPVDIVLGGSVSIASVIIVSWWLWGPAETQRVATN